MSDVQAQSGDVWIEEVEVVVITELRMGKEWVGLAPGGESGLRKGTQHGAL